MALATFPFTALVDAPAEGYEISDDWSTEVSEGRGGLEQRRQLWTYSRPRITGLRWDRQGNSPARVDTLWAFYQSMKGRAGAFVLHDWDTARTWAGTAAAPGGVYVWVGDGSNKVFDFPAVSASSVTAYVGGASAPFTLTAGAGANGRDRLTLTNIPAAGLLVTADFTGRRSMALRFAEDRLSYRVFSTLVYEIGLDLVGVKGEG